MLNYLSDLYVAKDIFKSGLPKVKGDEETAAQFKEGFGLSKNMMKFAGYFEVIGAAFLALSIFNKNFRRIGTVMINIIMAGAMFNHLKAGHGVEATKPAGKYFGLNLLSLLSTFTKK
ncbi:hypothetical protein ERX37_06080 [Macrococcus hajekii]|uniref:DoxX family protein n=1 Tax=Macrococcus hajekii TaxID=198482 RepID=A0A4R6BJL0_9STAP|nr:DoxX family protein [Macrococcus hajekii]TDM01776.1 hypothetical protein ERX37_06080 [Macrococcus hajekii]GGB07339.1 hypothetical protein GCM10007190_14210 [Macrococcus hajekii]